MYDEIAVDCRTTFNWFNQVRLDTIFLYKDSRAFQNQFWKKVYKIVSVLCKVYSLLYPFWFVGK